MVPCAENPKLSVVKAWSRSDYNLAKPGVGQSIALQGLFRSHYDFVKPGVGQIKPGVDQIINLHRL